MASLVKEYVIDGIALRQGLFRKDFVHQIVQQHLRGEADHASRIWSLIALEIWWRLFIARTLSPEDGL